MDENQQDINQIDPEQQPDASALVSADSLAKLDTPVANGNNVANYFAGLNPSPIPASGVEAPTNPMEAINFSGEAVQNAAQLAAGVRKPTENVPVEEVNRQIMAEDNRAKQAQAVPTQPQVPNAKLNIAQSIPGIS